MGDWCGWGDWGEWGDWGDWGDWGEWAEWAEFRNSMNTWSQEEEQQLHESSANRPGYECKPVKMFLNLSSSYAQGVPMELLLMDVLCPLLKNLFIKPVNNSFIYFN